MRDNVFISWSGEHARISASSIKRILQKTLCEADLWVSDQDIEGGSSWFESILTRIRDSNIGIICLTRENRRSPWLHYEAGAFWCKLPNGVIIPIMVNLQPNEVGYPLQGFQGYFFDFPGIVRLVSCLNGKLASPILQEALDARIEANKAFIESEVKSAAEYSEDDVSQVQTDREILEKIRQLVRYKEIVDLPPLTKVRIIEGGNGQFVGKQRVTRFEVLNSSRRSAYGVIAWLKLPNKLKVVNAPGGLVSESGVLWRISALGHGDSRVFEFTCTAAESGTFEYEIRVDSDGSSETVFVRGAMVFISIPASHAG